MTDDKETRLSALHAAQNRLATIVGDRFGQTVSFDSRSTTKTKEFVHFEAKFPDAPIELLDWLTIGSGLKHDLVPPFRFFDANEVCSFYDAQIKFYEKSKNLWGSASVEWDDAIPNGDKDPKLCKRNSTWHEGWIPIAERLHPKVLQNLHGIFQALNRQNQSANDTLSFRKLDFWERLVSD